MAQGKGALNPPSRDNEDLPLMTLLASATLPAAAVALCLLFGACPRSPRQESGQVKFRSPSLVDFENDPRLRLIIWPDYPQKIKDEGIQGWVYVKALIDTNGAVKETKVAKSTHPFLDTLALKAVNRWEFTPAKEESGRPVRSLVAFPVEFDPEQLVLPGYPEIALFALIEGTVVLKLRLDSDGAVREALIIRAPHPVLADSSKEMAKNWMFPRYPECTVMVPITFTIIGGVRYETSREDKPRWKVPPEIRVELLWPEE